MVSRIAPMLRDFMQKESAGGITLIFAAFAALVIANSPLLGAYKSWLDIPIVAGFGGFVIDKPLLLWVNDGLMAVFFFLIGLEVKREVLIGLDPMDALAPLPLGIALGLLIGKQAGILGFAWLAVKTGIASLPESVNWRQIHGLSLFAAIGFTMSLFIGNLAFASPEQVDAVKLGVLSGSTIAAIAGFFLLRSALPTAEEAQAMADPEAKAEPAE
ncbi:Na+/H+ antiporter NhaA [Altererythrobacter rubellus]|jgi:Na+/H+ antiporter NhaA|uniref:Putative Na(+)/H(+) antiporter NhaA homolog n=2 Tax=Altererythrobacter rubellus TaxID=2173831 RepID=A0A9Y2B7W5_9SPHN|nr:Na+/H+ antiporter NhaA [Altererythrobacter rubellus]WIW94700.1 Na+/H+ antiporter NhaA [Altererythrobacter rubellus]